MQGTAGLSRVNFSQSSVQEIKNTLQQTHKELNEVFSRSVVLFQSQVVTSLMEIDRLGKQLGKLGLVNPQFVLVIQRAQSIANEMIMPVLVAVNSLRNQEVFSDGNRLNAENLVTMARNLIDYGKKFNEDMDLMTNPKRAAECMEKARSRKQGM